MQPEPYLPKPTPSPLAAERFASLYFSPPARALLTPDLTPADFLRVLARTELYRDAFIVVVHTLPQRLHLWWACLCLRLIGITDDSPAVLRNFSALVRWIRHPTAAHHAEVAAVSALTHLGEPAYRLMRAVLEPEHSAALTLEATANIIRRAGDRAGPALYRRMLALAIDVERGAMPLPPGD